MLKFISIKSVGKPEAMHVHNQDDPADILP